MMLRKIPFHPFLLAMYPALALLANNISQIVFADTLRALCASILLAIIIFGIWYVMIRNWHKAALITSLFLLVFFSYGHAYSLLRGFSVGPILLGRTLIILPLFLVLLVIGIWWILSRDPNTSGHNQTINITVLVLIAFPLYTIISYYAGTEIIRASQKTALPVALAQKFQGAPPSIYYIILDMHARTDVLQKIYAYDNTWFTDSLKEKGFYIAEESTSNYSSTLQSISSSLNMEYINYLEETYGSNSNNREPYGLLLARNKVTNILKESGYRTAAFQSDDFYTEFRDADVYIKPTSDQIRQYQNSWALNSFEGILLQSTMARVLYDLSIIPSDVLIEKTIETPYQLHRLTILNTIEHLPDFAGENGPYFVFAHIISPHPPYVFGPNGQEIQHDQPYSLSGPARQNGGPKYLKLYIDQLHYTDELILQTVEEILARSKTPPIIIIQGDHGPVSYLGEDEVEKTNMWEQHAILNAYYFPGQNYDLLYPSVSPVNSFRIVQNTFFDGNYELLPDQNYFIPHARPYDFVDVTGRVRTDPRTP